ncbi:hypothetical protein MtrunA17_Chr2g0311361 [Medicago truncatula]|uniref:Epidermal patterning factor-like protein n=1 Tax=Medicago truncatula TaxID=3880 RepID=A0A396JDJ7_MEDTR|nr:hypothetical protein MtrunA17_Chr2g0311361 [Medicago truncatula]
MTLYVILKVTHEFDIVFLVVTSCISVLVSCNDEGAREGSNVMELYPTGSTIPDCSHACGPCSPCKRVMVGYNKCSMAESCPMVYRCICKGKYYHVPSN